jgi:hypothetical protein
VTWFDNGELPDYDMWSESVAQCLLAQDTGGLVKLMNELADLLTKIQNKINPKLLSRGVCGDTFAFGSTTSWHSGVFSLIRGKLRFVIYSQAVPTILVEQMRENGEIQDRYSAENVMDRRTMMDPDVLVQALQMDLEKKPAKHTKGMEQRSREFLRQIIQSKNICRSRLFVECVLHRRCLACSGMRRLRCGRSMGHTSLCARSHKP